TSLPLSRSRPGRLLRRMRGGRRSAAKTGHGERADYLPQDAGAIPRAAAQTHGCHRFPKPSDPTQPGPSRTRAEGSGGTPVKLFFDIDTQVDFMFPAGALYAPGAEKLIP